MARLVRLTQRYVAHARHLRAVLGERAMHDAGRTVAELGEASELPGPGDVFTFVPDADVRPPDASRRLVAHARRVARHSLWVWYWATDAQVQIVDLTVESPRRAPE